MAAKHLYDEEQEFFEQLISGSICKCHVSKGLFTDTFKRVDAAIAWLLDEDASNRVVTCPTNQHVITIFNIGSVSDFTILAGVFYRQDWLAGKATLTIEKCEHSLNLTTRQFDHETRTSCD